MDITNLAIAKSNNIQLGSSQKNSSNETAFAAEHHVREL